MNLKRSLLAKILIITMFFSLYQPVPTYAENSGLQLVAGNNYSLVVMDDGSVKAWGYNGSGQLGLGNRDNQSKPVIIPDLLGVKKLVSGNNSIFALMNDGSVKAWGTNYYGQLGLGNTDDQNSPVEVPGLVGVKDIETGGSHSLALMDDGTVKAWGSNVSGQLGLGNTDNQLSPVDVPGLTGVKQLVAGDDFTLALMNDGSVKAWGYNYYGQLGIGNTANQPSPVQVPGLVGVNQLTAGGTHTLALMDDGRVKAWGYNYYGQLGIGNTETQNSPLLVPGLVDVKRLEAGNKYTLALMNDGSVKGWGYNYHGQLGIGNTSNQNSPVEALMLSGVKQLTAGYEHSLALMDDGSVKTWGYNYYGQLGSEITNYQSSPTELVDFVDVNHLVAGSNYTLALMNNGSVKAWGNNGSGQLGIGNNDHQSSPIEIQGLTGVKEIVSGGTHALVLMNDGSVKAWGNNGSGQIGIGNTTNQNSPIEIQGLTGVKQLALGATHSLALMNDGGVKAWGNNSFGELGIGNRTSKSIPVDLPGLLGVKQLAAGNGHTLALMDDGTVKAWGHNYDGQLGIGNTDYQLSPIEIPGLNGVKQIAAGGSFTLALLNNGTVKAFGGNYWGMLGNGYSNDQHTPVEIPDLVGVKELVTGGYFTFALMEDGSVKAWGMNTLCQIGVERSQGVYRPIDVFSSSEVQKIAAGGSHAIALMGDGSVKAWGANIYGQLGIGSSGYNHMPANVTIVNDNTNLSNIILSEGSLSPVFDASTLDYTVSVANDITSMTVTPSLAEGTSSVKVNGVAVNSGTASDGIGLNVGSNAISIEVTAEDGSTKTYSLAVTRESNSNANLSSLLLSEGSLSPIFDASTLDYTVSVANDITSMTVTPSLAEGTSSVKVNGVAVNSGTASDGIGLNVGSNAISIEVTAEDGSTKMYSVMITRSSSNNVELANIELSAGVLSPVFGTSIKDYETNVDNEVTSIAVKVTTGPATIAKIMVNDQMCNVGQYSNSISLNVGVNPIVVEVTAEDKRTSELYRIYVTRAGNSDATLTCLEMDYGTLLPEFTSAKNNYTAEVENNISEVRIKATTGAAVILGVKVNDIPATSGEYSQKILLNTGVNVINVNVIAEDGSSNNYEIQVKRKNKSSVSHSSNSNNHYTTSHSKKYNILVNNDSSDFIGVVEMVSDVSDSGERTVEVVEDLVRELLMNRDDFSKVGKSSIRFEVEGFFGDNIRIILAEESLNLMPNEVSSDLSFSTSIAELTFDRKAFQSLVDQMGDEALALDIKAVDKKNLVLVKEKNVDDIKVYDFTIQSGNQKISDFNGGRVTIRLPYELGKNQTKEKIVVYYFDGSNLIPIRGDYDEDSNEVVAEVDHFSTYAVGYSPVEFNDVNENDWFYKAVSYISAREITAGDKNGCFMPNESLTRADYLVMLMRAYGIEPSGDVYVDSFADAGKTYYSPYIGEAKALGITNGIGDNLYGPDEAITREQMMTLLYNSLTVIDELNFKNQDIEYQFTDEFLQSDWAKESIDYFASRGVVKGSGNYFYPKHIAKRGELAQLLYNLLNR